MSLAPLGIWLLLRESSRKPVIYLRAFKTDQFARRLRRLLKAALSTDFRLCGIRPPRERSSLFIRLMAEGVVAYRYLGSSYFELEAHDQDWMARLLATYARSAFLFIDARELTKHVENEIRLSYLAMGSRRCIFLIDFSRTEEQWLHTLRDIVSHTDRAETKFHLLAYPDDQNVDPHSFVSEAREIIDQLPKEPVDISEEAVAFAKSHVADRDWETKFWHTDAAVVLLIASIGLLLFLGQQLSQGFGRVVFFFSVCLGLLCLPIYYLAWGRALKEAKLVDEFRRRRTHTQQVRLWCSFFLVSIPTTISILSILAIPNMNRQLDYARQIKVMADVRGIRTALITYNGLNGFYPTTKQGLEALVMRPTTEPLSTSWMQLFDEIPKDPWEDDYVYVCPGVKHPDSYDLYSAGPDRKPGTADDDWGE